MGLGLVQVQDYEQIYARKLNPTDYTYNPQVGFISLNQTLQANDVLGVAFQYSYNGKIYQVGEFSQDIPPDTTLGNNPGAQKVLYLKLLKATSQRTDPADLEPDDEKYLHPENRNRQLPGEYPAHRFPDERFV